MWLQRRQERDLGIQNTLPPAPLGILHLGAPFPRVPLAQRRTRQSRPNSTALQALVLFCGAAAGSAAGLWPSHAHLGSEIRAGRGRGAVRSLSGLKSCGEELGVCAALLPECGPRAMEKASKGCALPTRNTWLKNPPSPVTALHCTDPPEHVTLQKSRSVEIIWERTLGKLVS